MASDTSLRSANDPVDHRYRILLIEDHVILRAGLKALLEMEPDLVIAGEAGDARTAIEIATRTQPNLVITDIALPGRTGIQAIGELREICPAARILVLTAHNTEEYVRAALGAGAHGYVLKDASRLDLLQAIRTVMAGQQYLCSHVSARVVSGYLSGRDGRSPLAAPAVTEREREVLTLIALGQSNKRIANELGLSVKTVEKHRANLMRKLSLHNTAAVTMYAIRNGLVGAEHVTIASAS